MKPPIVINDSPRMDRSGDLRVYDSVSMAERSIEYEDAMDDQLHVFDSEGRLLKIVADESHHRARLEVKETSPTHQEVLITILQDFLVRLATPKSSVDLMDLPSLLICALERAPNPYSGQK